MNEGKNGEPNQTVGGKKNKWSDGSAEGRQDTDDDYGNADAEQDMADAGEDAEALLHQILFHKEDSHNKNEKGVEVRRVDLSDVEMVYHRANAASSATSEAGGGGVEGGEQWGTGGFHVSRPDLVQNLRALADEFGESGEIVEVRVHWHCVFLLYVVVTARNICFVLDLPPVY